MCSCDDNMPAVYREEKRVARKEHTCWECRRPIAKGDIYVVCSGVWDGRGDSYKWCDTCATISNLANGLFDDWCFIFGDLQTCVEEALRGSIYADLDVEVPRAA